MDLQSLMECKRHLRIAHHVPGRIRIKFSADLMRMPEIAEMIRATSPGSKSPAAGELLPLLSGKTVHPKKLPGVDHVRLNLPGRSLIVHYRTAVFEPEWIDEVLTTKDTARLKAMVEELAAKYQN